MKLLLIGCGHMGKALLKCFEANSEITDISVVDPAFNSDKHQIFRNAEDISGIFDVFVLAVKPQIYPNLKVQASVDHVISVMAGISHDQLSSDFSKSKIVRLMPNMAVSYKKGLSILYGQAKPDRSFFNKILDNTGALQWVEKESDLDLLTLFNACGPGLLLGLLQEFVNVLQQYDLEEERAAKMMRQVFIGTSAILENDSQSLPDLIGSIATKAGITEACLNVLQPGFRSVLEETIKAGLSRIRTLKK